MQLQEPNQLAWFFTRLDLHTESKGECRIWTGPTGARGAPVLHAPTGKRIYVRAALWRIVHGFVAPYVKASCGLRSCIAPVHLVCKTERVQCPACEAVFFTPHLNNRAAYTFEGAADGFGRSVRCSCGQVFETLYHKFKTEDSL